MISISEIIVVLLVAVVVIKPEQLPEVAYTLGKWSKRVRSTLNNLRAELDGTVKQLSDETSTALGAVKTEASTLAKVEASDEKSS